MFSRTKKTASQCCGGEGGGDRRREGEIFNMSPIVQGLLRRGRHN